MNIIFKQEVIEYEFLDSKKENTILFLHGWGGNLHSFDKTKNLLKSKFNILSLTLPTTQPTSEIWDLCDYVNLVKTIIVSHDIFSPIIICHSFGFRIATILDKILQIEKIVVIGGAGPKKIGILKKIDQNNTKIISRNKNFQKNFKNLVSADYLSLSPINKETFKNIVNFNTIKLLKFHCPILCFWGENDHETPIWIAKKISKINHSKLIKTDSDHFAYLKKSELFNNSVLEFLC